MLKVAVVSCFILHHALLIIDLGIADRNDPLGAHITTRTETRNFICTGQQTARTNSLDLVEKAHPHLGRTRVKLAKPAK